MNDLRAESSDTRSAAERRTLPTIDVERLLASTDRVVVDLRSPSEYADDHVPGAHGVPLLDDAGRALVGTIYKQRSPEDAFTEGRRLVLERVTSLVEEIARAAGRELPAGDLRGHVERITAGGQRGLERSLAPEPARELPPGAVVLHCWRGGLRSASVAALLIELGWRDVYLLEGGYKRYRRHVLDELERWRAPAAFVLRGLTGVGKTLVLRELERQRPGWTVDLEALAGHRSSILGMVGLEPVSQRSFDSRLAARLRQGLPGPAVFEGESRKVGDVVIPARVWAALDSGTNVLLEADVERRVDVLIEDYLEREENRDKLRAQLPFIENRLGSTKWAGALVGLLDEHRERELVAVLLERYYDPLYRHSEKVRDYALRVDATDPARAAREVAEWIESRR
jgi:tRNA 2-selenouridine synthase